MGWNGSGQFTRDNGVNTGSSVWTDDAAADTKILASLHDVHDENFATGLENCVTRDGQNTPSNDLPMATYKHTGVGASSALTQYARTDQVQKLSFNYAGTSGTSTAYVVTLSPAPAAYAAGLKLTLQFDEVNGANPTINVNSLGAANIYAGGVAAPAGTFQANLYYELVHDGSTGFHLVNAFKGITTWSPSYGASGSMTIGTVTTSIASYQERGPIIDIFLDFNGTTGGTASNTITFSLPVNGPSGGYNSLTCVARNGVGVAVAGQCVLSGATASVLLYDGSNFGLGTTRGAWISGSYMRA